MSTTTNLDTLVINYLSQLQYDEAVQNGTLNENQLYLTPAQVLTLATVARSGSYNDLSNKPTIPTKTSELTNDSGFITDYTETDPTVPSWAKQPSKPSYTATEVGALPDTTNITLKFLGQNPVGGNDTAAAWRALGTGFAYISSSSETTGQPSQLGILVSYVYLGEISQEFRIQSNGSIYRRGGNSSTTTMPAWTKIGDNITYSTTDLTAGSSALTTGEVYLVYE